MFKFVFFSFLALSDQTQFSNYHEARHAFWNKYISFPHSSLYCQKHMSRKEGFNIEHVFPKAWMKKASHCKVKTSFCRWKNKRFAHMEADLQNFYPSVPSYNNARGSLPFAVLADSSTNDRCDFKISRGFAVEPSDLAKGKVARALLYMAYEYQIDLDWASSHEGLEELMHHWNCAHPADEAEVLRNLKIQKLQGTSNPYVSGAFESLCQKK